MKHLQKSYTICQNKSHVEADKMASTSSGQIFRNQQGLNPRPFDRGASAANSAIVTLLYFVKYKYKYKYKIC